MVKNKGLENEVSSKDKETLSGLSEYDTIIERPRRLKEDPDQQRKMREHKELVRLYESPVAIRLTDGTWNVLQWIPDKKHVRSWKEKNFGSNYGRCFRYALSAQLIGLCLGASMLWLTGSLFIMAAAMLLVFVGSTPFVIPIMEKLNRSPIESFRKIQKERVDPINQTYIMYSFFILAVICTVGLVIMISQLK